MIENERLIRMTIDQLARRRQLTLDDEDVVREVVMPQFRPEDSY